jgi:uncharacterized protein
VAASVAEALPHALLIDVGDLLENFADSVTFEGDVPLEPIALGAERFVPVSPVHVIVELTYAGSGIVASGTASVSVQATCSRCLRDFELPLTAPVEGFYVRPGADHDFPEDQEVELIHERSIDLYPAMHAAVILELPFAPLHDPDCSGICPSCGVDRNETPCSCERDLNDSPFAALQQLLEDSEGPA